MFRYLFFSACELNNLSTSSNNRFPIEWGHTSLFDLGIYIYQCLRARQICIFDHFSIGIRSDGFQGEPTYTKNSDNRSGPLGSSDHLEIVFGQFNVGLHDITVGCQMLGNRATCH